MTSPEELADKCGLSRKERTRAGVDVNDAEVCWFRTRHDNGRIPKIRLLQERNVRTGFVDDAMIDAIIDKLPKSLRPVARFAYVTGWRVQSEVLPLEWRSVDRKARDVRLEPGTTKNDAGRVFPFTDTLRALLDELSAEHEALQKAGRSVPTCSIGTADASKACGSRGRSRAMRPGIPVSCCTTFGVPRSATWSGPASQGRSQCS